MISFAIMCVGHSGHIDGSPSRLVLSILRAVKSSEEFLKNVVSQNLTVLLAVMIK
jgi:hypothetical protein